MALPRIAASFAEGIPMADYPVAEYSKREIKDAGAALRERMPYTEEAVRTFRVAHNWRMAHALPMIREKPCRQRSWRTAQGRL
ncbi:hypothetical protein [Paracoccus mutanolyticus]|nr:hypothetical protein [Paracoccus mutanolyticus]